MKTINIINFRKRQQTKLSAPLTIFAFDTKNTKKEKFTMNRLYNLINNFCYYDDCNIFFNKKDILLNENSLDLKLDKMKLILDNIGKDNLIDNKETSFNNNSVRLDFKYGKYFSCSVKIFRTNEILIKVMPDNTYEYTCYVLTTKDIKTDFLYNFFHKNYPEYFTKKNNKYFEAKKYIIQNIHIPTNRETMSINKDKDTLYKEIEKTILYGIKNRAYYPLELFLFEHKLNRIDLINSHLLFRRIALKSNSLEGHEKIEIMFFEEANNKDKKINNNNNYNLSLSRQEDSKYYNKNMYDLEFLFSSLPLKHSEIKIVNNYKEILKLKKESIKYE
jgi:hypothetical protein